MKWALLSLLATLLAAPLAEAGKGQSAAPSEVSVDQRLGRRLPGDIRLTDEAGRSVMTADLIGGKPALLTLVYFGCPNLCTLTLNGLADGLRGLPLRAGRDFDLLVVSIDPSEGPALAAPKRLNYLKELGPGVDPAGVHFLTGDAAAVARLADTVGFRYRYDEATRQYAHPSVAVVLTPDRSIGRYLYGIEFRPRDLRLALTESSRGKIGTPLDAFLLLCFHYEPNTGRYGAAVMNLARLIGAGFAVGLAFMLRQLSKRRGTSWAT